VTTPLAVELATFVTPLAVELAAFLVPLTTLLVALLAVFLIFLNISLSYNMQLPSASHATEFSAKFIPRPNPPRLAEMLMLSLAAASSSLRMLTPSSATIPAFSFAISKLLSNL